MPLVAEWRVDPRTADLPVLALTLHKPQRWQEELIRQGRRGRTRKAMVSA